MTIPALKVYAAAAHSFNFAGLSLETGRGEDQFAAWDQQNDDAAYKAGVDGEGTMSVLNNTYTEVTATFMQTADANTKLSTIRLAGLALGAPVVGPIFIRDRNGKTVFAAANAWIKKPPAQARGREVGALEWIFGVHAPGRFDGGS